MSGKFHLQPSFTRHAVRARFLVVFASVFTSGICGAMAEGFTPEQIEFFETKIRPVFASKCYECHAAEAKKLKAGFRLDNLEGVLKGGESGPAVVPGDPGKSLLFHAVRYHNPETAMPPKEKLEDRVIADIEQWVKMGAPWPAETAVASAAAKPAEWNWEELRASHWAFQPMQRPVPPVVTDAAWPANAVDQFVLAKLEAEGMTPAPAADRLTLIRRASFDLIGLPPTVEEVDAFVNDTQPDAFARVVDRLLASPHYGERWARHWLDVARYSDGMGGFLDGQEKRNEAWRYRDWVVNALNRDLPFDQFVRNQIAGDQMEVENVVATGFLALGPNYISDGGTPEGDATARAETLDDRVDTVTRGLLALTVSCARCHDHKFDPIPTQDYYSIAGVFQNTRNDDRIDPLTPKHEVDAFHLGQKVIQTCEAKLNTIRETAKKQNRELSPEEHVVAVAAEVDLNEARKSAPPACPNVHAVAEAGSGDMHVALRGNLLKPGELAPRRFLKIVAGESPKPFTKGSGRLELAEAIVDPENPLTARVMVNRVWMHHFGRALVRTPDNFGKVGEKPTHPELLDWLARAFIDGGWSLKKLHRTILLSSSYQMSSRMVAAYFEKDGDNRLIWRMEPRRLDAEAWRDALLAVTGGLDATMGGPSTESLLESPRRTLYSIISRNGDRFESDDFLRLFDLPSARATSAGRKTSIVPQQFLFMMNNPFMMKRAQALVKRLSSGTPEEQISMAYRHLFGRPASAQEIQAGLAFLHDLAGADGPPPVEAWCQYAHVLLSSNEFLFIR